ncbi:CRISPR-associated helicase cas3 [Ligilactobacillus agilis]|nr:CRISPR-associated helicase Cas3' [Ligilactobacillus agilis]GET10237.1 CRISPR-associated helicase cas3 [Ligilactobacillus agilis]
MNLSNAAKSLWGKKKTDNGQQLWLPLVAHLIDTKNVINWLFNHWISDGQREIICGNLSEEKAQQLVNLLGYSHDLGKATPAFQIKESYNQDKSLDKEVVEKLIRNGFAGLDSLVLANAKESPHNRAGEALLEKFGLNKNVGAIIGGHHGKPENKAPRNQLDEYKSNYWQTFNESEAQKHWQKVQKELVDYGLRLIGFTDLKEVPKVNQQQAVLLTGLLIMADWIASSEYLNDDMSKPMFPTIDINQSFDDLDMNARYRRAIKTWKAHEDTWEPERVTDIPGHYQKRWGFYPRPVQEKISEIIGEATDPGIVIIEAPMGIGKTEIALTAAEQLAFYSGRTGLYMGLPTQATSNAMFTRIKNWLESVGNEEGKKLSIKLMHGKAQFNKEYTNLIKAENIASDGDSSESVIINSWFSGKKSVLDEFTIGTVDNLLLMGLKQKHLFLKHLGFSNKVVVIDEVHAYDAYMSSYLDRVLEWLGAYHVPVVILSATLPKDRRNKLLQAYSLGKFGTKKFEAASNWQKNQAYPLMSMLDNKNLVQVSDFEKQEVKDIDIFRMTDDEQAVINFAVSKIEDGGIAGIIVNTVKRAQALVELVPDDIPTMLLHSAFLAPDRAALEDELQGKIGKRGSRPEKLIVIGTQVLEQSLDIDFDVMFTDIAPMDLILQRVGRLHRHNIERPKKLEVPQLYVMGATEYGSYSSANEAIYARYLLLKTDYFLSDKITLPDDISPLVQSVYDKNTDYQEDELTKARSVFDADKEKSEEKAGKFQIEDPKSRRIIHGWLGMAQLGIDKDEVRAQATVRDIKETIEVILLQKRKDGYYLLDGRKVSDLEEKNRDKIIAQQVIRLPVVVTQNIGKSINYLEGITIDKFRAWQQSIWLKGALALVLDEQQKTDFNGWNLSYSPKLGLRYEKQDNGC